MKQEMIPGLPGQVSHNASVRPTELLRINPRFLGTKFLHKYSLTTDLSPILLEVRTAYMHHPDIKDVLHKHVSLVEHCTT